MKNFFIKIDKDEVVVSESEYAQIKAGIRDKSNLIFLREGKLVINPIMIKLIQETNKPTEIQEKAHEGQLRLSPGERQPTTRNELKGFNRLVGGGDSDFKKCESCGEMHFLAGRRTCIVCACKEKSEVLKEVF